MVTEIEDISRQAMRAIARQEEALLRAAIRQAAGDLTDQEILERGQLIVFQDSGWRHVLLDGKEIIAFGPISHEFEGNSWRPRVPYRTPKGGA